MLRACNRADFPARSTSTRLDTGKSGWIDMKPILEVMNEALKAAGKN
jgi:hypothetical protein